MPWLSERGMSVPPGARRAELGFQPRTIRVSERDHFPKTQGIALAHWESATLWQGVIRLVFGNKIRLEANIYLRRQSAGDG